MGLMILRISGCSFHRSCRRSGRCTPFGYQALQTQVDLVRRPSEDLTPESQNPGAEQRQEEWMQGILSAAGYVPYWRLDRGQIRETFGAGGGRGQRAVASYDE